MVKALSIAAAGARVDAGLLLRFSGAARPGQPRARRGGPPDSMQAAFDRAMVEYTRCHWKAAWEQLAHLADAAHPVAARLALDMHRFGPRLFGGAFHADTRRLVAWARCVDHGTAHAGDGLSMPHNPAAAGNTHHEDRS